MNDPQEETKRMASLFWDRHGKDAVAAARQLARDMRASEKPDEADFWLRVVIELEGIARLRGTPGPADA